LLPWLHFTKFTSINEKLLDFTNKFLVVYMNTVPCFAVVIWLLVTFRLDDFKIMPKSDGKNG
jgi:hypothetical protein